MRNKDANLIPLQPVQQCDADDSGLDTSVMGQRGESQRFHLDIHNARLVNALEVLHLIRFREVAERPVQTTLPQKRNSPSSLHLSLQMREQTLFFKFIRRRKQVSMVSNTFDANATRFSTSIRQVSYLIQRLKVRKLKAGIDSLLSCTTIECKPDNSSKDASQRIFYQLKIQSFINFEEV